MDEEELSKKVTEYDQRSYDRKKLRFCGTGPLLKPKENEPASGNKFWPKDSLITSEECRKIFHEDIRRSLITESRCRRCHDLLSLSRGHGTSSELHAIRAPKAPTSSLGIRTCLDCNSLASKLESNVRRIVEYMVDRLRKVNVRRLFDKYCTRATGQFDMFYSLDAHTRHHQIFAFIHQTLRSLNKPNPRGDFLKTLFGSHRNFDIFKKHLRWLVIGNRLASDFKIGHIVSRPGLRMDIHKISWLDGVNIILKYRIFIQVLSFIITFVIDLLRRYFYITHSNNFFERLIYFRYDLWRDIKGRKIDEMKRLGILENYTIESENKPPFHAVSNIRFSLKYNDLRLICTRQRGKLSLRDRTMNQQLKYILKHILAHMPNYEKFTLNYLLNILRKFKEQMSANHEQIYIVRADMKDCYQSVDQNLLDRILMNEVKKIASNDGKLRLSNVCVNKLGSKRHVRYSKWAIGDSNTTADHPKIHLHKISECIIDINELFDRSYIRPHIIKPILKDPQDSRVAYRMVKGLRQGSSFSPILCAIYIQAAINKYLEEFLNCQSCKVICYADDILFISTNRSLSEKFLHKMLVGFTDFNLRMNMEKLECNFEVRGLDASLCKLDGGFFVFHRQKIYLETLKCSYNYSCRPIELQDTFQVSPFLSKKMIEDSTSNYRIELIHLDSNLNGHEWVVKNVFEKATFFAHRVATMILMSYELSNHIKNQDPKLLLTLVRIVTKQFSSTIKEGCKARLIESDMSQDNFMLRTIVAAAFLVTWQTPKMVHRKLERDKLLRLYRRYKMKYLVCLSYRMEFVHQVEDLIRGFPRSSFAREIILPSKRTARRHNNQ